MQVAIKSRDRHSAQRFTLNNGTASRINIREIKCIWNANILKYGIIRLTFRRTVLKHVMNYNAVVLILNATEVINGPLISGI